MHRPWTRTFTGLLLALLVVACQGREAAPLSVVDLRLPADGFPGIVEIVTKTELIDDYPATAQDLPGMVATLRDLGIRSTAYYRYLVDWHGRRYLIKFKINVFKDKAAAARDWRLRYPEAFRERSTALLLGDEGFKREDAHYVWRDGRAQFDLQLKGEPQLLREFAQASARHAAAKLAAESG